MANGMYEYDACKAGFSPVGMEIGNMAFRAENIHEIAPHGNSQFGPFSGEKAVLRHIAFEITH